MFLRYTIHLLLGNASCHSPGVLLLLFRAWLSLERAESGSQLFDRGLCLGFGRFVEEDRACGVYICVQRTLGELNSRAEQLSQILVSHEILN